MVTGYSTVSSVVLWLMLGYVWFSYLIRIVVFFNRYRYLDCCTALSGRVFRQFLLLWRISLFCPLFFFHSLCSDLFYNVDVYTFCCVMTPFNTSFCTVYVNNFMFSIPLCCTAPEEKIPSTQHLFDVCSINYHSSNTFRPLFVIYRSSIITKSKKRIFVRVK